MVNYKESFVRPFKDFTKLAIGILISIIPIVKWIARGYMLECSGLSKRKVPLNKMPKWVEFGDLFVKGVYYFLISLIYFIPFLILMLIGAGVVLKTILTNYSESFLSGSSDVIIESLIQSSSLLAGLIPIVILAVILGILAAYLIPMAGLNYLRYNDFRKAFDFKTIFRKTFNSKYLGAWLLIMVITLAFASVLQAIPLIGYAAAFFIPGVIGFSLYGQIYKEIK